MRTAQIQLQQCAHRLVADSAPWVCGPVVHHLWAGRDGPGSAPKVRPIRRMQTMRQNGTTSVSRISPISASKCNTPICHVSATISGGGQVCDEGVSSRGPARLSDSSRSLPSKQPPPNTPHSGLISRALLSPSPSESCSAVQRPHSLERSMDLSFDGQSLCLHRSSAPPCSRIHLLCHSSAS
jgi:hypothetical protein